MEECERAGGEHRMGKKSRDLFAAFIVGNGVLDLLAPRERYMMWVFGPQWLRELILWFADHPTAVRLRGVARIGIGLSLALKQYEELKHEPAKELESGYRRWLR